VERQAEADRQRQIVGLFWIIVGLFCIDRYEEADRQRQIDSDM